MLQWCGETCAAVTSKSLISNELAPILTYFTFAVAPVGLRVEAEGWVRHHVVRKLGHDLTYLLREQERDGKPRDAVA